MNFQHLPIENPHTAENHTPCGTPETLLREVFGFTSFKPGQREIIDKILQSMHVLAVMPTGAGKSLCYQVPALLLDRLTIVVSPLVALIDNQVAALRANGVSAAAIHNARPREQNIQDWRLVQSGKAKLLYMSPERLMTEKMLSALDRLRPAMFVIDEAHCISKWGVSFRKEYSELSELKNRYPQATISAFTATADVATQREIVETLFGGKGCTVVHGFNRPNLWLGVAPKTKWREQLIKFLNLRGGESGIVYCLSRRSTEEVAHFLVDNNFKALAYHAGLLPQVRKENQETFMAEPGTIMVATVAFGMGIDKADIRYVIHLDLPGSLEAYYQEIGRAGRDGNAAHVFMIYGLNDIRLRRQMIEADSQDESYKRREHRRLDSLLAYCEASQCRRIALLAYFDESTRPCGNCDICLDPPKLLEGTREAQMLFSAIVRTGERFGATHVIDVLLGRSSDRVKALRHDKLRTFGVGSHFAKGQWQSFIRQAVAGNYLSIDIQGYGALHLTNTGRQILNGTGTFEYREHVENGFSSKAKRAETQINVAHPILLSELKNLRRRLASESNVPAFVVFSDKTLHDMCDKWPSTMEEMLKVSGVGPTKLQTYGKDFLATIRAHNRNE